MPGPSAVGSGGGHGVRFGGIPYEYIPVLDIGYLCKCIYKYEETVYMSVCDYLDFAG